MNTGIWVECTHQNILNYDMFNRSNFDDRDVFERTIEEAWERGETPRMWIVDPEKEDHEDTQTTPGAGSQ